MCLCIILTFPYFKTMRNNSPTSRGLKHKLEKTSINLVEIRPCLLPPDISSLGNNLLQWKSLQGHFYISVLEWVLLSYSENLTYRSPQEMIQPKALLRLPHTQEKLWGSCSLIQTQYNCPCLLHHGHVKCLRVHSLRRIDMNANPIEQEDSICAEIVPVVELEKPLCHVPYFFVIMRILYISACYPYWHKYTLVSALCP